MRNTEEIPPDVQREDTYPTENTDYTEGEKTSMDLAVFLAGIYYPASKDDIIDHLVDQGVGPEILEMLDQLPDTAYNSPEDVSQALAESI